MLILQLSLVLGALACLCVGWASWAAGFPLETALVRGLLAFVALSLPGYVGELIVATAPPWRRPQAGARRQPPAEARAADAAAGAQGDPRGRNGGMRQGQQGAEQGAEQGTEPGAENVSRLPVRSDRQRRAA